MTPDQQEWLLRAVEKIGKDVAEIKAKLGSNAAPARGEEVADDRDLDGEHGNFVIRKDPKRWTGPSYVGCKLSECPPEYLDVLADFRNWQAGKEMDKGDEEGTKKAGWLRRDVARCRGWAKRLRAGWTAPVVEEPETNGEAGDSIPF